MPQYFITEDSTVQGSVTVDGAPERAKGVVEFAAGMGVNIIEFFYCTSQFDFIMKVEAPDDETVTAFCMAASRSGNVVAKATRAFNQEEWTAIVKKLP
jgi:uncharacterized protein with GYD domain